MSYSLRELLEHVRQTEGVNQEALGRVVESIIETEVQLGIDVDAERSPDNLVGDLAGVAGILLAYGRVAPYDALLTEGDFTHITMALRSFKP